MNWNLINSETQDNRLPNELFMVKAECSASLDTRLPQETHRRPSGLLTNKQHPPAHPQKKAVLA